MVPQAKSSTLLVFVNKVLWQHGHAHFFYVLSMTTFSFQWQSWVVVAETVLLTKPNIFIAWPFLENVCQLVFCPKVQPLPFYHFFCLFSLPSATILLKLAKDYENQLSKLKPTREIIIGTEMAHGRHEQGCNWTQEKDWS